MLEKLRNLSAEAKAFLLLFVVMGTGFIFGASLADAPMPPAKPTVAAISPKVSSAKVEEVAVPKLKVYKKADVVKKVDLPDTVKNDPNKQVTAVVDVKPSKGGSEVVAVVDVVTGETTTTEKPKPVPMFAFVNEKKIGLGYGIGTGGNTAKVFLAYDAIRAGKLHIGVQGEMLVSELKPPYQAAMVTLDYRW